MSLCLINVTYSSKYHNYLSMISSFPVSSQLLVFKILAVRLADDLDIFFCSFIERSVSTWAIGHSFQDVVFTATISCNPPQEQLASLVVASLIGLQFSVEASSRPWLHTRITDWYSSLLWKRKGNEFDNILWYPLTSVIFTEHFQI